MNDFFYISRNSNDVDGIFIWQGNRKNCKKQREEFLMSKEWLTKQWVTKYWEADWDEENVYFTISETGTIRKYNTLTDELFEYEMERVEH